MRGFLPVLSGLLASWVVSAAQGGDGAPAAAPRSEAASHQSIRGVSPEPMAPMPLSRAELEGFIDGLMEVQLRSKPVAGAVVAVVKDGELFFAKGYGYADVAARVPMDPQRTLVRVASITKLFVWTAVMQLVEQGKLDLDADVNTYLKAFRIPATYSRPVSLRHVMTHTAGFEDGFMGYHTAVSDQDFKPLSEYVPAHMPTRVRPPTGDFNDGSGAAYSNWAATLAGYVVEAVSGEPYDEYLERHILQPLEMSSSTPREPLPAALASRLSKGYAFVGGAFVAQDFQRLHNIGPAGSISATATDMAKFMLAHLQEGAARMLRPDTLRRMHARALSPDPLLDGMTLGFFDAWVNGRHTLSHGGNTGDFHSMLSLVPEARLGMFVSFNTVEASSAAREFERAFLKHYFPARLPTLAPRADATQRNVRYAGTYRTQRRAYTKAEKLASSGEDVEVVAMPDGTLVFANFLTGKPARWIEVGEGVFRAVDEDTFVAFKSIRAGRATRLVGPFPVISFERMSWYDSRQLHRWLVGLTAALTLTTLVSAIRRRDRLSTGTLRWARPALVAASVLLILSAAGVADMLSSDKEELYLRVPQALLVYLTLALLALPLLGAALVAMLLAWQRRAGTIADRVHYTAVTLAVLGVMGVLHYWNLLGYRFG